MENFEKLKELKKIRTACEEFPAKWQAIMANPSKDKKYLTFDNQHSGIKLCLGAHAGNYGSSSVYQELPVNDTVKAVLVKVLEEKFPEIWSEVVHKLKMQEQSLYGSAKSELDLFLKDIGLT